MIFKGHEFAQSAAHSWQIRETQLHRGMNGAAPRRTLELLQLVAIDNPEERIETFHQLSGGQRRRDDRDGARQRATTVDRRRAYHGAGCDGQAQVLDLLLGCRTRWVAMLLITHDLGVVRKMANRSTS